MTSLSGPEISGPHNDVGEIVRSWSGPETPGLSPVLLAPRHRSLSQPAANLECSPNLRAGTHLCCRQKMSGGYAGEKPLLFSISRGS